MLLYTLISQRKNRKFRKYLIIMKPVKTLCSPNNEEGRK